MYLEDMQLAMIRIAEYVREDRLNNHSGEISMTANRSVILAQCSRRRAQGKKRGLTPSILQASKPDCLYLSDYLQVSQALLSFQDIWDLIL